LQISNAGSTIRAEKSVPIAIGARTMQAPVVLPEIGIEPGTEMLVSFWFADEGEEVLQGDRLVEILAGSVTFDVPAPATGRLVEVRAAEEDPVHVGDILGIVESGEEPSEP
jgi:pyruvate dehydrogenase E2 component (dihydrolipoamide acetyltransferase)